MHQMAISFEPAFPFSDFTGKSLASLSLRHAGSRPENNRLSFGQKFAGNWVLR
jgi:hypothetical protein